MSDGMAWYIEVLFGGMMFLMLSTGGKAWPCVGMSAVLGSGMVIVFLAAH